MEGHGTQCCILVCSTQCAVLSVLYLVTMCVVTSLEIKNLQEDSEVFWNVTPCRLVNRNISEDEGPTLLRNGGNYCLVTTA